MAGFASWDSGPVLRIPPVIGRVRDVSLEEILAVLFRMQKDLNGIGNNYNQMIHRLHITDSPQAVQIWNAQYEKEREKLFEAIGTVKDYVLKTTEKWLR